MTDAKSKSLSILVVDDYAAWRGLSGRVLREAGHVVHSAATCAEAIGAAWLHKPDCILLDFHLSDGDATTVISTVRENAGSKSTTIIVLSSDPFAEARVTGPGQADGFVLKDGKALLRLPEVVIAASRRLSAGHPANPEPPLAPRVL